MSRSLEHFLDHSTRKHLHMATNDFRQVIGILSDRSKPKSKIYLICGSHHPMPTSCLKLTDAWTDGEAYASGNLLKAHSDLKKTYALTSVENSLFQKQPLMQKSTRA
nr:hypothetical protein [Theobroma cacao]